MKPLIIAAIVIIVLVFGYNKYADYQRFSLENYEYKALEVSSEVNQETLMLYHNKVAQRDGYVITQWSAHNIDVRNPEDDDAQTLAARAVYDKYMGDISFLESQLKKVTISPVIDEVAIQRQQRNLRVRDLFKITSNNDLRIGSKGPLVYELQKLLNENGATIPEDGNFQRVTFEALKSFEESKKLFADGKLDILTLSHLLE